MQVAAKLKQIGDLVEELDTLGLREKGFLDDETWMPTTERGREIFAALTAIENREAVRTWYARYAGMPLNPTAEQFCRALEKVMGENLH